MHACCSDLPCRVSPQTLCGSGTYAPSTSSACSPCPFGTYNSLVGVAECVVCPPTAPFSLMGSKGPGACMCPSGHACAGDRAPILCGTGTYAPAGSGVCSPCPAFTVSPAGADSCVPECPGFADFTMQGMYVDHTPSTSCERCMRPRVGVLFPGEIRFNPSMSQSMCTAGLRLTSKMLFGTLLQWSRFHP